MIDGAPFLVKRKTTLESAIVAKLQRVSIDLPIQIILAVLLLFAPMWAYYKKPTIYKHWRNLE